MRITTAYDRLKATAERKVTCPGCGGKRTIRKTFHQTVNPFNRTDDGRPKTRPEVQAAVNAQAMLWELSSEDLYHNKCAGLETA